MFIEIFVLDRCGRGLRKISVAAGGMCTQIGLALDGVGWTHRSWRSWRGTAGFERKRGVDGDREG